jgi:large subunit ribosomal protein L31
MKKNTHPSYEEVLFVDSSTGTKFLVRSTLQPQTTQEHEGRQIPVCPVSVSSASHPAFTGSQQFIDTEGRVDKFFRRYGKKKGE